MITEATILSLNHITSIMKDLRIVSLIPSATDILIALELEEYLTGVTHECKIHHKRRVTVGKVDQAQSQGEIHAQVQKAATETFQSLYPINREALKLADPTLVITQDLCSVCAPTTASVCQVLGTVQTLTLTPHTLDDIWDNIVAVAKACGVEERGVAYKTRVLNQLQELQNIVSIKRQGVLLEWLDPPFDGGHWIPDMMAYANVACTKQSGTKSIVTEWPSSAENELVWVACCGLDLARNITDAQECQQLQSYSTVYACDGDSYFAKPGPQVLIGILVLALTAHTDEPTVVQAIRNLDWCPKDILEETHNKYFQRVVFDDMPSTSELAVADIEDWNVLHERAYEAGELSYKDPVTGYSVFTSLAHTKRGYCCGSGCRHCPYAHENVKDKAAKIQQPALMCTLDREHEVFSAEGPVYVLFVSGGKDSFLALRALVQLQKTQVFQVVLLTTFDATSRIIAHQNVSIDMVMKQAEHLGLPLMGVPMHRGSKEGYVNRIERALDVIEKKIGKVDTMVFGDLHLDHIRGWREEQMGEFGSKQLYPIWGTPYEQLAQDLDSSCVPCTVTGTTVDHVKVNDEYNKEFRAMLARDYPETDVFGERGEFHTLAKVWETSRSTALGWDGNT